MFIADGSEISSSLATCHWPSCVHAVTAGNALQRPFLNQLSALCPQTPLPLPPHAPVRQRGARPGLCAGSQDVGSRRTQSPSWPRTGRSSATLGRKRQRAVVTAALTPDCPSPEPRTAELGPAGQWPWPTMANAFCRLQNPMATCTQGPGEPGSYSASQTHQQPLATSLSFPGGPSASQLRPEAHPPPCHLGHFCVEGGRVDTRKPNTTLKR